MWPKNIFVLNNTLRWKKFVEAIKKFRSFFFANFDFFGKKTCATTSRRASFEDSLWINVFTYLQKLRIFLGQKKHRYRERLWKAVEHKKASDNFWSRSCGENLWGDIWAGAVLRCCVRLHVRPRFCPHSGVCVIVLGNLELFNDLWHLLINL